MGDVRGDELTKLAQMVQLPYKRVDLKSQMRLERSSVLTACSIGVILP